MVKGTFLALWRAFHDVALLILIDDRVTGAKLGFLNACNPAGVKSPPVKRLQIEGALSAIQVVRSSCNAPANGAHKIQRRFVNSCTILAYPEIHTSRAMRELEFHLRIYSLNAHITAQDWDPGLECW